MAGTNIKLTVNDRHFQRAMKQLARVGDDRTDLFMDIGEQLINNWQDRINAQIDADGNQWEPLKPATIRSKLRRNKSTKTLIQDRHLRDRLSYQVTHDELLVGSNLIYAATHQFGDSKRGIPKRPFLGISEQDKQDIIDIINDHLNEALS